MRPGSGPTPPAGDLEILEVARTGGATSPPLEMWARTQNGSSSPQRDSPLVAPGRDAQRLESLFAHATDAATGTRLAGARVSIVSGYKAGASCLTNTHGACEVPRLLNGEEFVLQVEHAGYELLTADYQFDVLSPTGGRNSYWARLVRKP